MSSESRYFGNDNNTEKKKRGLFLSTRVSWTQLDEDFYRPTETIDKKPSISQLVDHREENLCNWMDSGFYLSGSKDSEESMDRAAAYSPPMGMVHMTVQNYMRSLHRFSEMPVLSRWNSVSSSHSLPSTPKSITEWLDLWEKDPVEVLLDLGFGTDEPDICTKIPSRFISCASSAEGINIRVFIEAQRQRIDLESPNLCGRFRQLQVLDHVTSAFSSLLSDISAMQPKMEEGKEEEKSMTDVPKGKAVVTQAKRKKIGQLLRKASRQTTMHGPQSYRNSGPCKAKEDCSAGVGLDIGITTRTGLSDSTALVSLTEELVPNEETVQARTISQSIPSRATKRVTLPHRPTKQTQISSTSEMPIKDRPRKEPNLLLTQTLRRVSSLSKKLSDSFEMEEIQSFEDEFAWGNPLESTSDTIVTRTSSCQSDSSGFLEDPSEPVPLQGLSLPGNTRLSYSSHDCQAFLRHRKESPLTSQDLLQNATGPNTNISAANGNHVPLQASLSREHNVQGEETFYSISEEDYLYDDDCSGESGSADNGKWHEIDEKVIQGRRGQLDKRESYVEVCLSHHHAKSMNQADINILEENSFSHCGEEHHSVGSTPAEESCMLHNAGQTDEDGKECEEEEIGGICQDVLEAIDGDVAEEPHDLKACETPNSPSPLPDVTNAGEKSEQNMVVGPMETTGVTQTEHSVMVVQPEFSVTSRSPLQDASQADHGFGTGDGGSLDSLPVGIGPDEDGCIPGSETNTNPFKSVTVQMPSRLMSTTRSISFCETAAKSQSADFTSSMSQCSKEEPQFTSVPKASKGEDRKMKEASIQTDGSQGKKGNLPSFQCLPSFHRPGHLVKSASLDTGLYWKHRPPHQPLNAWCAQHRGHSCSSCSHHCCSMWLFTPSFRHPMTCCSSHTATELQLLKTLQLLQDSTMKNISSCTVHEIQSMKNSCQKFRERLDEIEQHLTEQETLFSSAMSKEGREERRRLQVLRQAVRREVAELECQLQDRARQVREGMLMHLDQLLDEQTCLYSELGISDWRQERETKGGVDLPDLPSTPLLAQASCSKDALPDPPSAPLLAQASCPKVALPDPPSVPLLAQASCSKAANCKRTSRRSALIPSSTDPSSLGEPELSASVVATNQTSSTSDPEEFHTSKKEPKGPSQPKMDFKTFIQNLKRSFRSSFTNDTAEGRD